MDESNKVRENELIFAMDIGTRSIVGVVGEVCGEKLKVLAVDVAEHSSRAMMDGQIDNIRQVADLARTVTKRLEDKVGVPLTRVCVAAAGRALQTQKGSFTLELDGEQIIDAELIGRLEAGAVSKAEENLQAGEEDWRQMFLVGYTVAQYRLDNYPLNVLLDHKGQKAEVDVVATFLPGEVVESLYSAMKAADLQVASITLEPIAAMNAAIPAELRLLNLALVDIGAGTTDIALCRDGSVVGYTMATIAGDEITEAIMRACLVDFATAETMKRNLMIGESVYYQDILGIDNSISYEDLMAQIQEPTDRLAEAIAKQVLEVNMTAPSALFLAGGGSKLHGLRDKVARSLNMDEKRVAIAGHNFQKTVFSDVVDLNNPEYTTPLGIAVSAGLGLLNDSYVILLNGQPAKLFRSGVLTVQDVLLMNGYTYADMIGKTGKNLSLTLNGRHILLRGEPAAPAILALNGETCAIRTVVHAGDHISFTPAQHGADAKTTVRELVGDSYTGGVMVNNRAGSLDQLLRSGDVVLTLEKQTASVSEEPVAAETMEEEKAVVEASTVVEEEQEDLAAFQPVEEMKEQSTETMEMAAPPKPPFAAPLEILLNDQPLVLPPKENGEPYFFMDLLEHSGIDFETLDRPVWLAVNGSECGFQQRINTGDSVTIQPQ